MPPETTPIGHGWLPVTREPWLEALRVEHEGVVAHRLALIGALRRLECAGCWPELRAGVARLEAIDALLVACVERVAFAVHARVSWLRELAALAGTSPDERAGVALLLREMEPPALTLRGLRAALEAENARWLRVADREGSQSVEAAA